jgi:hypothetical protein
MRALVFIWFFVIFAALFGELRCGYKAITADWDNPPHKAETIYTIAFFTGFGGIVGYFNIDDDVFKYYIEQSKLREKVLNDSIK